ncbi:hypothetical protein OUZ56_015671 [Daphnia magna]|uniref:Uncharacterized protein n=1 Tax=Daphnia magna TaxID=35525 RepID=A0ABR0ANF2_9CRUS|nr:hypothetical protein OUZ56_015671 [Daphnia magna]
MIYTTYGSVVEHRHGTPIDKGSNPKRVEISQFVWDLSTGDANGYSPLQSVQVMRYADKSE